MADVVVDTFTEAANVNLEAHVPDTGTGWSIGENTSGNSLQVLAANDCLRVAVSTTSARIIYLSAPDPASAEYDVEFRVPTGTTLPTGNDDPGFAVARWIDANNYYSAGVYQDGAVRIFKKVAGVVTQLAAATGTLALGDLFTFKVRNASKSLWKNGTQLLSSADNSLTAAGRAGFGTGNAWVSTDDVQGGWRWDDYSVFDYPAPDPGTTTLLAQGVGTTAATSATFTPTPGTVLMAIGLGRDQNVSVPIPNIGHTGTALTWIQAGTGSTGWDDTAGTDSRMKVWLATVPPAVSLTAVTMTFGAGVEGCLCAVFAIGGATTNVIQYAKAPFDAPVGTINFANPTLETSLIIAIDGFAGVADLTVSGTFVMDGEITGNGGGVNLGLGVAHTTGRTNTNLVFGASFSAGAAGAGCVIGIELQLAPAATPAGSGTGFLILDATTGSDGRRSGSGTGFMLIPVDLVAGAVAAFSDVDLTVPVLMGGFGGRFFVPAVEEPTARGETKHVFYTVKIEMAPNSFWDLTNDVRAFTVDRRLAIYPNDLEAGTCDVVLDDTSGRYSPYRALAAGNVFRPNMVVDIQATWAALSDNIVRSYWLFRGLIDSIDVNPSIDERTVNLRCRDFWKVMHEVQISTSMMVDYNAGSVLAVMFQAASIGPSQHSIDATADVLPFASFLRTDLNTALEDFVVAGGYAAYVAADGVFRVRNKYFDIGGQAVTSYWQVHGLNFSLHDDDVVNRLSMVGQPRYHVQSRQIVSRLDQIVTVAASQSTEFWIDYFDPRNNDPAGARNGVQPLTGSGDWFLNTSSSGLGTNLSATGSLTVTFYGDGAKVRLFNGAGNQGFLTKLQMNAEPILTSADVSVLYEVASSQVVYGVRDEQLKSRLFATQTQLEVRATDLVDMFSGPLPTLTLQAIDDFPGAFLADLGKIVTVRNEHIGLDDAQFTIYGLTHEVRADDVGLIHQINLELRLAREGVDVFILDTSHLDVDRLGR